MSDPATLTRIAKAREAEEGIRASLLEAGLPPKEHASALRLMYAKWLVESMLESADVRATIQELNPSVNEQRTVLLAAIKDEITTLTAMLLGIGLLGVSDVLARRPLNLWTHLPTEPTS